MQLVKDHCEVNTHLINDSQLIIKQEFKVAGD